MKYLIDLDGTIINGKNGNRDSVQFINELQRKNAQFVIMTNSIKSPQVILKQLEEIGISLPLNCILNPISTINSFLKIKHLKKPYIVGNISEIEQVILKHENTDPEIIILLDCERNNTSYDDLQNLFSFIQNGIPVISASDSTFYIKNSKKYLDTGAFVKLLESAGDIKIEIFGKPSVAFFNAGISLLEANPKDITVIGDDWSTDIIGATNCGCNSILIKSGKYSPGDENKCKPIRTVKKLMEIIE